jgi:poly-beta-1,6-N-acetyl-D-glucosamine N-deacetylase
MRLPVLLLILFVSCAPAWADSYAVISFHDVRDDARDLGPDDITTARLTDFFDWLAGNGWSVVSIDDLEAARMGKKPLPPKAILLTFDDGYSSIYTRVYPLLRAYGFHAVFFLVGSWMDVAPGGMVQYGDEVVPRDRFLSWDQAREMTASGLAEFGSHTYRLHLGVRGNPQGSSMPAAATWTYDPKTDLYETDAALEARVAEDLGRSAASMRRELGRAPRVLAWPFGRTSGPAMAAAHKEGFTYVMGLAEELADTSSPLAIQRLYPTRNPTLSAITSSLNFGRTDPEQRRIACLSLDRIVGSSEAETDAALGRTIEDLRRLGSSMVVLEPFVSAKPGEPLHAAWFKSSLLPTKADFLGFAAWQIRSRAGVEVYLHLDIDAAAASVGRGRVADLARELARVAPVDGIMIDPPGPFLAGGSTPTSFRPWSVRDARDRIIAAAEGASAQDRLALDAWDGAKDERPRFRLGIVAPWPLPGAWPAPGADVVLLKSPGQDTAALAQELKDRGWLDPAAASRLALPLDAARRGDTADEMRRVQALGASSFALCPASLPASATLSAAFSAARFPRLP